jgi:hypothetical protein
MGRETQRLGKRGEYTVLSKLLDLGLDIYEPIVDVENIDCIVRTPQGEYNEVQVKTRTKKEKGGEIFQIGWFKPRPNFFVVLYIPESDESWVLPSKVFFENRVKTKYLEDRNLMRLILSQKKKEELHPFRDAFHLLKTQKKELHKEIERSGWEALKKTYPSSKAVEERLKQGNMTENYKNVLIRLKRYWEKRSS